MNSTPDLLNLLKPLVYSSPHKRWDSMLCLHRCFAYGRLSEQIQWNVTSVLLHLRTVWLTTKLLQSVWEKTKPGTTATSNYQLYCSEADIPKFAATHFIFRAQIRLLGKKKERLGQMDKSHGQAFFKYILDVYLQVYGEG